MNWGERKQMPTITISELKDGSYYVGRTNQRGMPIGMWEARKQKFLCIKTEMGGYTIYEMNHIEKDDGFVCFEPVAKIEIID